jgi:hypothetical protein
VSIPTLTLVATPDPEPDPAFLVSILRDDLALRAQEYGELLAAAKAAFAADAAHLPCPLTWLREHLELLDQVPPPGARPTDYVPTDEPVRGRW